MEKDYSKSAVLARLEEAAESQSRGKMHRHDRIFYAILGILPIGFMAFLSFTEEDTVLNVQNVTLWVVLLPFLFALFMRPVGYRRQVFLCSDAVALAVMATYSLIFPPVLFITLLPFISGIALFRHYWRF